MLFSLLLPSPVLIRCRVSVVYSIQSWLAETPDQKSKTTTPAYFSVGMARKSSVLYLKTSTNISQ